jgi:hypothetical protein
VSALAKVWNAMSDGEKNPYEKISKADHLRFEDEMSDINKRGYFIDKDG